jgi:hypothetical protein
MNTYFFRNRIISEWYSLPENVITVKSVNSFENALDKWWSSQDVEDEWTASLLVTMHLIP